MNRKILALSYTFYFSVGYQWDYAQKLEMASDERGIGEYSAKDVSTSKHVEVEHASESVTECAPYPPIHL